MSESPEVGIGQEPGVGVRTALHNSQTQQVLIEYYWGYNIVLLHGATRHTSVMQKNVAWQQSNSVITQPYIETKPSRADRLRLHVALSVCTYTRRYGNAYLTENMLTGSVPYS